MQRPPRRIVATAAGGAGVRRAGPGRAVGAAVAAGFGSQCPAVLCGPAARRLLEEARRGPVVQGPGHPAPSTPPFSSASGFSCTAVHLAVEIQPSGILINDREEYFCDTKGQELLGQQSSEVQQEEPNVPSGQGGSQGAVEGDKRGFLRFGGHKLHLEPGVCRFIAPDCSRWLVCARQ